MTNPTKVSRSTHKQYEVRGDDALGRNVLTARDLRALVRALDEDGVPDDATWESDFQMGRIPDGRVTIQFTTREEIES